MNPDPLAPPPPPKVQGPDSFASGLATAATSRKGRSIAAAALPYLLSVFTAVAGWAGGKIDSKAELQAALALREDFAAARKLAQLEHEQEMAAIAKLSGELISPDVREPGRVVRLERDQYFAWRALTEVKATTLGAETAATKSRKSAIGAKFAHSFDLETQSMSGALAFDSLFRKAVVE